MNTHDAPGSPKSDPESLVLRAPPRNVLRFKRALLIGIAGVTSATIFGVTWWGLKGSALRIGQQAQELYNTERKTTPDGLAALPGSYGQIKPDTPTLGSPLPGDLGRPTLEHQRQMGIAPGTVDQAAAAERQRLLQQSLKAREAGVMFQINTRPQPVGPVASSPAVGLGGHAVQSGFPTPRPRSRSEYSAAQARFPQPEARDRHL
jgi:type IV secretion system protein VirB10